MCNERKENINYLNLNSHPKRKWMMHERREEEEATKAHLHEEQEKKTKEVRKDAREHTLQKVLMFKTQLTWIAKVTYLPMMNYEQECISLL